MFIIFTIIKKAFSDYDERKKTKGSFIVGLYFFALLLLFIYQVINQVNDYFR